VVQVWRH